MKVFTYYNPIPELRDESDERKLIELWAASWAKHGWEPVVLGEDSIGLLPDYKKFHDAYYSLPTAYGHEFETASFLRWYAVWKHGGGMLTDYDVINYGFPPRPADGKMTLFTNPGPRPVAMGVVLGEDWQFKEMSEIMAEWVPDDHDNHACVSRGELFHCSDVTMLSRMFDFGTREKPPWFDRVDVCQLVFQPGWETAPLVHYFYAMHDRGFWPKHAHIHNLRPF